MSNAEEMLAALEQQNLDLANKKFTLALKHDDDDTLFSLAEELQALGFNQQCRQICEQLLTKYPDADEARLMLAEIAINDDQTDRAQTLLDQISEDSPIYAQSLLTAADFYQTLNLPEVSEQKLLQAQSILPDEPVVTFALGELYLTMGNFEAAISAYQGLLTNNVTYLAQVSIDQRLAESYAGKGDYEQAVEIYERLTSDIASDEQLFQLGVLYQNLKEYDKAIKILVRLQQQHADYGSLYRPLVESQLALNQDKDALKTAQVGLGYDQYNLDLYRSGAQAALRLGEAETAEKLLIQGLKMDPDAPELQLMMAELDVQSHREQAAIDLLAPLVGQDSADPQVDWLLAMAYNQIDQVESARNSFFTAYSNYRDNPQFMRDFINFLQTEGMKKELSLALHQYLKLVPDDVDYAELLLELGEETKLE